jgi:tRNA-2-methylthio-N6-dimethylallyladenosine synthase
VEGYSKRSRDDMFGRTQQNKVIVFPAGDTQVGQLVHCRVDSASSATLKGQRVD